MQKKLYDKQPLNKLIVVNKPLFKSSNAYLNEIKRKYKNKKAGFSGTLDPFASGCLIVAFGQYSKLFNYLEKTPKKYKAVIWLGTTSLSLDSENIIDIGDAFVVEKEQLKREIEALVGTHEYYPPKFSAKKIEGKRAYDLAREGKEFAMKKSIMQVYDAQFISYSHPFITFEVTVSEGSYIRSLAQILLQQLDRVGTLSHLHRMCEGKFHFNNEKALNPLDFIALKHNTYTGDKSYFEFGKKIDVRYFTNQENGEYVVTFDDFFSIIQIKEDEVKYLLNKVSL